MNFCDINFMYAKVAGKYMCNKLNSACHMDQPSRVNRSIATASRTLRLVTAQELLLEYSLVVIILAFSFLVSLIPKSFRVVIAGEDKDI